MSSGIRTPITIYDAVTNIEEKGIYVLPSFQREFLWKREQIENLFDSLMRGYPISSMLMWKIDGNQPSTQKFYKFLDDYVLDCRNHQNKNSEYNHITNKDYYAVLDGQQRLTALRIGLLGKSYSVHEKNKSYDYSQQSFPDARLYLRLKKNEGSEYECTYTFNFLKDEITDKQRIVEIDNTKWFFVSDIVKIHLHEGGLDNYFDEELTATREEKEILRRLYKIIFDEPNINYYEEESTDADKALNIFIRINSGGSPLSYSDIVFSLIVGHWNTIDARTKFKELCTTIANLGFKIDKTYIIKVFLVLFSQDIKTSANNFPVDFCLNIEENWNDIEKSIVTLFELLKKFSLTESALTSLNATLPVLYYIFHKKLFNRKSNIATTKKYEKDRKIIQSWIYKMILLKPFGAHTNTPLLQSRTVFGFSYNTENRSYNYIDNDIDQFPSDRILYEINSSLSTVDDDFIKDLLETQKDNVYAFSILALLFPNLDYSNPNDIHKDHMHPESAYDSLSQDLKDRISFKRYNSIVNLQMLNLNDNTSKNDKSLKEWVKSETESMNPDTKIAFFNNHLIPYSPDNPDDINLLDIDNIEDFLNKREELLSKRIREILQR